MTTKRQAEHERQLMMRQRQWKAIGTFRHNVSHFESGVFTGESLTELEELAALTSALVPKVPRP